MGNCLVSYRAEIGLFYNRCQKVGRTCKVSMSIYFSFSFIIRVIKQLCHLTDKPLTFCYANVHHIVLAYAFFSMLLIMSGDVESNPGPIEHCLSIIHSNIRSIRNKLEFIKNNLLDFDVLCFSESHLDASIDSSTLILSDVYDVPYRKDRTNHGEGIQCIFISEQNIISQRMADLEIYWNECIWIKIKQKS